MTQGSHYFSRLRLKGDTADIRALARIATSDLYREHRMVWQFFPKDADAQRDFLYRREESQGSGGALTYFVVSRRPPDPDSSLWSVETKAYAPVLHAGDQFEFSLRANPVVHRKETRSPEAEAAFLARRQFESRAVPRDTRSRKRDDVVFVAKQKLKAAFGDAWKYEYNATVLENAAGFAWIEAQGERLGFAVTDDEVSASSYQQERFTTRSGNKTEFSRLDFSGRLTVTDPECFHKALLEGIGPAKAFGCGLLLVRRV
ncbi:type I-E CRISPR-associated protein Cas6/Cse3/CasE [Denitratisoma oestradiolicum]|uniref:Putative CRISPR-associated protein, Cse3 family n=1 Tax=Denitratisoma oestradiolicum TaxID=311182 RepID=A0A6S6XV72_9PROT|nr:type I-E CRISPR-associated protein Cas6/Cse3/CasE [Denitratisoma oestradiolicum]TWO79531.1 type I-E CRISPR-associated protein Cas6/Cse3/CasE [Denitratisoma oestradiolicum]CAB1368083.1 putative CRISPR-associated protein, Cse3 family [Denitratisoma oestradiolicum]